MYSSPRFTKICIFFFPQVILYTDQRRDEASVCSTAFLALIEKFLWRAYLYMLTHCKLKKKPVFYGMGMDVEREIHYFLGWLPNRWDMWKKENLNLTETQWQVTHIFVIRREKNDTDEIFRKGIIFFFQSLAKYLFESRDLYAVTYKPVYVSTKISVELNPYSKL